MHNALTEIRISRSALIHNVKAFRGVIGPKVQLMVVVKSNAYGHGVGECAPIFAKAGVDWFGVASLTEALQLRHIVKTKPILVLSFVDGGTAAIEKAIQQGIRLPAYTKEQLRQYQRIAQRLKKSAFIHLKFDTGTSRIGFLPEELPMVVWYLQRLTNVQVEGVYSHFSEVESNNKKFTLKQLDCFTTLVNNLESSLARRLIKHIDCSAGVLLEPQSHFDMVRVGMSAYGIHTVQDRKLIKHTYPKFSLIPVLTFHTTVIQVKRVTKGVTIGYNRTFTCKKPTTIAVLPVGYWDGLDRKLSNIGSVIINGKHAPIRGRVCMNLTMVDVTGIAAVHVGSQVTFIGCAGPTCLTVEALAKQIGTISYEVLTRLNPSIARSLAP
ncbi:MAG: alanine racemase [Patescibacteria group bacterium]